jgi:pyruvate, water dikinase
MTSKTIESGLTSLDEVLQGLRLGDNVVWQVDNIDDYIYFAQPFADQAVRDGRNCIYVRFAPHDQILKPQAGLTTIEMHPTSGFDSFSSQINRIIEEKGKDACYIFDNLSSLLTDWATDELVANFFQVTCPLLAEFDTVAYFALTKGLHNHRSVARIRDTTQVLIDAFRINGKLYIHPLKVWDRYSSQMFLPHILAGHRFQPVFDSSDASEVTTKAHRDPLSVNASTIAPWDSVYQRLLKYHQEGGRDSEAKSPEISALKQELSRIMIGDHPTFNKLADTYLTVDNLLSIRTRMIGSGRIGGKAAGMLVARKILRNAEGKIDFSKVLDDHDSFYIGSDVFFTFLVNNNLFRLRLQLSRKPRISHEEFEEVERRFLAGKFPDEVLEWFRDMLDYFGQAPIIVRSSSLLEDSFGNSFAGKYRSEFIANQGSPEQRLQTFIRAVKLVYASAVNPDALSYRHHWGLSENDEQMAILVQRVSGNHYQRFFFPTLSGVAFSRNLYVWNNRINPEKGIIRLVFGLGTRAVNRVVGDYPRMIAVSDPMLRPETGTKVAKYSQRKIDLIDLEANEFLTKQTAHILTDCDYSNLHLLVSTIKDGYPQDPVSSDIGNDSNQLVLTFNNLLKQSNFVSILDEMLTKLEKAYNYPIDTEFTAFVDSNRQIKINLLQCRPMRLPGTSGPIEIPENISRKNILFRSNRIINGGIVKDIQYIIYISPEQFNKITDETFKKSLGRLVGRINEHPLLKDSKFIMMGPGRWGSSNINLGVNVSYADINNTAVLVEMAIKSSDYMDEVSYGTHFFLDLVESEIIYLPVYPYNSGTEFNAEFFKNAPSILPKLLPESDKFSGLVNIIDIPSATGGKFARIVADPPSQAAVCYLV